MLDINLIVENIDKAIIASKKLSKLSDKEFIKFVRNTERENPDFIDILPWIERVKQETNFRLLNNITN